MKFLLILIACLPGDLTQQRVSYEISFKNAVHHEARVMTRFEGITWDTLEIRMSRTSPGRYALHEFAKNIYDVSAVDGAGKGLPMTRQGTHQWNVPAHNGTVVFSYTLFGDVDNGTYSAIDPSHAHLNMPATFVWARGFEQAPVRVEFKPLEGAGWKVATQLMPTDRTFVFCAPNLQYFMDSPTELSNHEIRSWQVRSGASMRTINLAIHHIGTTEEATIFSELVRRIVAEEQSVFGELPEFENGTYTFILDYLPYASGDGMEHRNSTVIAGTRPLKTHAIENLSTIAHEFFHCWNIERIRPRSLEPFNFEETTISGELWFGEGFTNYYERLSIRRAGIISLDRYAQDIGSTLNQVLPLPGRKHGSAVEMSQYAPFVDGAAFIDRTNTSNRFISYYPFGAAIALGLDLTLRTKYPGVSLDDFMREVWASHGRTEIPFTNQDLEKALARVTRDEAFARDFFGRYIYGREVPDFGKLLGYAGFVLRKAKSGKAWIGNNPMNATDGKVTIGSGTTIGSPLYEAGLDQGDRIIKFDGVTITSAKDVDSVVNRHSPGDRAEIEFEQRGAARKSTLTFAENPQVEVVPFEHIAREVTPAVEAMRASWLSSKLPNAMPGISKHCPKCRRNYDLWMEYCPIDGESLRVMP